MTEELTHLVNDAAHKVSTPIDSGAWPGTPKIEDVTLIHELGDCFSCLIGGHICHYVLYEMVLEHQDIGDLRWSVQLQACLYTSKVYMQEVHQSSGHNQV